MTAHVAAPTLASEHLAALRLDLTNQGVRLGDDVIAAGFDLALASTGNGVASEGVDLILPGGWCTNVCIAPGYARTSAYVLALGNAGGLELRRDLPKWTPGLVRTELAAVPEPDAALVAWTAGAGAALPAAVAEEPSRHRWSWMHGRCQGWPGSAPRPAGLHDLAFLSHDDPRPIAVHLLRRGEDWILLRRILPVPIKESP